MTVPIQLGILTPFVAGEYLGELVARISRRAGAHGACPLIVRSGEVGKFALRIAWQHVDAWIVIVNAAQGSYVHDMLDAGKVVVSVAHDFGDPRATIVASDNESSMYHAVSTLIRAGHRHIAFAGYLSEYDVGQRHAGYRRALESHDIAYRPEYVIDTGDYWQGGGVQAARHILAHKLPITALFAGTDHNAAGALTAFRDAAVRVPEDIAIVGYDNTTMGRSSVPALASIDQNFEQLAESAVSSALEQLASGKPSGRRILVQNIFIPRASCGLPEDEQLEQELGHKIRPMIADEYELGRHMLNATPESIQATVKLLAPQVEWRCIARWDDPINLPNTVTVCDLYDYLKDSGKELAEPCELEAFPPLATLGKTRSVDPEHFLCVLPVQSGQDKLRMVCVSGRLSASERFVGILNYLDLLAGAFERSALDEDLRAHQAHLEDLVEERTAELQERSQELLVEKDRAESANRAKSAFLSSMSHELRTPLNAILGYAQILKRDKGLSKEHLLRLETIERSGEHLLTLIDDILDLAKIEAGKATLNPRSVDFPMFLRVIADIIRVKAEQKSLLFVYDIPDNLPSAVQVDERRLRQVLLNLLSNAVKFTERGEVDLFVRVLSQDHARVRLRFEVCDTGVGIEPAELEKIFEPFEQAGDFKHRVGGTGLGLAISRELVQLMGGDIHVESKVGQGSVFWLELELPVVAETESAAPERRITGYDGARKKVLVVDDVVANRAMIADFLDAIGFDTFDAENGQEGTELAERVRPDLIVMDIVMPGMNGFEAIAKLRQSTLCQEVPIVAVSASATEADQRKALAVGANAFLPKPIELSALLEKMRSFLSLNWHYETVRGVREPEVEYVKPPAQEMRVLLDLAMAGNMRDIRLRADHLSELDDRYRPFAEKLRGLAATYQSKRVLEFVRNHQ